MPLPLQELDPDFYISFNYPIDEETKKVNSTTDKSLYKLIELLYEKGFSATIRPGEPNILLIFIRLAPYKFIEEAEKDLIKNYEFGVTSKDDQLSSRFRIIFSYLTTNEKIGGCGITPREKPWENVLDIVPITTAFDETFLIEELKSNFTNHDLSTNQIKKIYGVQIALYFEFFKYYIYWLIGLSVLGIFQFFKKSKTYSLTYSFINLIWGTFFINYWHRKEQYLVNLWGVQNSHLIQEHKSELAKLNEKYEEKSTYVHQNNVNGYRFLKQLFFIPIALGFVGILVSYQLGCFFIEIFLTDLYDGPGKSLLTLLPTILISVFIPILTIVYNLVAEFFIKLENHDNHSSKNNSIIVKQFILNFLVSYAPLLITSFLYLPFAHLVGPHLGDIKSTISTYVGENRFYTKYLTKLKSQKEFQINQGRLDSQFFYFIFTNQIIQAILKYVVPLVLSKAIRFYQLKIQKKPQLQTKDDNSHEAIWLHNVRNSLSLPEYDVDSDMRSLIIQYGYLIMFGSVWPLAPLISVIFDILFYKLDNFKLQSGRYFKPPIPKRVDSIHPWNWALFLLTWIGSVVQPVVTAFYRHGTAPPKSMGQFAFDKASVHVSSSVYFTLLILFTEHGFLILSYILYKLGNLFKSDIEWENDFVDNDMKLRHDYYSNSVKPTIKVRDIKAWEQFNPENTLQFRPPVAVPTDESLDVEKIPLKKQGFTTSLESSETTVHSRSEQAKLIAEKEKLLRERQAELQRLEKEKKYGPDAVSASDYDNLNKSKDEGDSIIESKSEPKGQKKYSTIDNNKHRSDNIQGASVLPPSPNDKFGEVPTDKYTTDTTPSAKAAAAAPGAAGLTTAAGAPKKSEKDGNNSNSNNSKKDNKSSSDSTSTPSTNSNSNSNSNNSRNKDQVNVVDDEKEYKKLANETDKESKHKKSGLKKLFNKI
ncbi:uncharacterized protein KGF55_001821 [Candida pseudojiufengensis]|uniref:uncharacterized protein n=1 Tax=Candida pseudojiufengensis TaxID=497109 RepID=UPI002224FFC5|nr:uncharacterized protein KGF55_001821 [Candida pseudojiufengensis]KAI5964751.1 hypothetical protein KGF55_001821 [Candida pseudojiufengensis]